MIRKATIRDLNSIENLYNRTHDLEEAGFTTIGWKRNIYPTRKTAEDSINRDDMFVYEKDGQVVSCAIINKIQVAEYANCKWEYDVPDEKITVLHTLVVSPEHKGKGIAKEMIDFYELYAYKTGAPYLRMDTNNINTFAREMYKKLNFKEPGIVKCNFNGIGLIDLVCLEKRSKYLKP